MPCEVKYEVVDADVSITRLPVKRRPPGISICIPLGNSSSGSIPDSFIYDNQTLYRVQKFQKKFLQLELQLPGGC